ncbi:MAG: hypothetical protein R2698_00760 [Microthrixaceae bacterium]
MTKTAVQKAVSFAPSSDRVNHALQRFSGRTVFDAAEMATRHRIMVDHFEAVRAAGLTGDDDRLRPGCTVLEVGTGWHPAVPVLFWLCGAQRVVCLDHVDHGAMVRLDETVPVVLAHLDADASLPLVPERVAALRGARTAADLASVCDFERRVGGIESVDDLSPFDVVTSSLVLEHVPAGELGPLVRGCFDRLSPDGVMSHGIDLCDHGHYTDPAGVSQFNFLRFPPRVWRMLSNPIQHENRLRASEYLAAFGEAGVPFAVRNSTDGDRSQLSRLRLAEPYRDFDLDDLVVIYLQLVSHAGTGPDRSQ